MARIRAYVIGPQSGDLDVFYTLPTSIGAEWQFEYLSLARPTFELELIADVHRAHAIRNAIVVVVPTEPLAYHRLAIAHAWREGVRRFILLFANREQPTEFATDELEQELRVLLDELGDGGAAPALRAPLTRCAGRTTDDMKRAMIRLLDEVERVFPPDDVVVHDAPLPASFAKEAAILDTIAPLVRSGTLFDERSVPLVETVGRSHMGGWPHLPDDEPWPVCPRCKMPAPCFLQVDMRDVLHAPPPAHRCFVVYRCASCYSPDNVVVRHYDSLAGGRPIGEAPVDFDEPRLIVMERLAFMLPDYEIVEADHPETVRALQAIGPEWGRLWWWAESLMGMGSPRIPNHLGGWHTTQSPYVPKCACEEPLYLVSSTQWGDWWNCIWACPVHPDLTEHTFQK